MNKFYFSKVIKSTCGCLLAGGLLAACSGQKVDGWYVLTDGVKDSVADTPIVTVADFRGLQLDSVTADGITIYTISGGLKPEKIQAFADATEKYAGHRIGFLYKGEVIMDPRVNGRIDSGNWQITEPDREKAFTLYLHLKQTMGAEADAELPDAEEAAMEEPILLLPNTAPITFKQHIAFNQLLTKLRRKYMDDKQKGSSPDIRTYPEFNEIVAIGKPVIAPLLFILIQKENQYLLPLYNAIQDPELCSSLPDSRLPEKMEETFTLFVEKVLKQKRHRFGSQQEKLKAIKQLLEETGSAPDTLHWSPAQLDSIYLLYDYDLFKAAMEINQKE